MGERGPIPKRSDELTRRNKPEVPIDKIPVIGPVEVPDLDLDENVFPTHPMVEDFYKSLRDSAQSKYYEPSDWQFARLTLHFVNTMLWSSRPSSQMLASVNSMLTELLVSEGSRRRVRLEIERNTAGEEGKVLQVADLFRQRLEQPAQR